MSPKVALTLRILITLLLLPVLLFAVAMLVIALTAQNVPGSTPPVVPGLLVLVIASGMLWIAWKSNPQWLVRLLISAVIAVFGVLSLLGQGR